MKQQFILAYDLGTSGVKAALYDASGGLVASRYKQYATLYPTDGWREQRPLEWWNCIREITKEIDELCGTGGGISHRSFRAQSGDSAGRRWRRTADCRDADLVGYPRR